MRIEEIILQLKAFSNNQEKKILKVVGVHEASLVDYNVEQMLDGRTANEKNISPEYSSLTVSIKKAKGQPYNKVTLHDEGDFQSRMFANTSQFPILIDSHDYKTDKLVKKYGSEIFGLDKSRLKKFIEDIREDIQEVYKNILHV